MQFVCETLGDADGIGVVDESGFIKKGTHSVGVKRQYSGTAGKVENCQIGTFLSYASAFGHVFVDRRLYLPEEWSADAARRAQAKVPADVAFQTKPQQAIAMLESAWAHGVPMRWVCGDEVYGESTALREVVAGSGRGYVLAVRTTEPIWLTRPALEAPQPQLRGRPRTRPRLAEGAPSATTVQAAVSAWPDTLLATPDRDRGREGAADLRLGLSAGGREPRPIAGPTAGCWRVVRLATPRRSPTMCRMRQRTPHCSSWPRWPPPVTPLSSVLRKARARRASMSTRCVTGTVGTGISRSR